MLKTYSKPHLCTSEEKDTFPRKMFILNKKIYASNVYPRKQCSIVETL